MLPAASVMTLPPSARPVPTESDTERVFSIPCADPAEGHSTAARAATTITEREGDNPDSVSRNTRRLGARHGSPAREVGVVSAALAALHENSLYVSRRDESMAEATFPHELAGRRPARCAQSLATHSLASVYVAARTTGPTNSPTTPKLIKPPMTPPMISSIGSCTPRRINTGRRKLSSRPTGRLHIRSTVAQPVLPIQ